MIFWAAGAAIVGLVVGVLWRRRRRGPRRHTTIREDLFEGLLPSAVTGSPERSRPRDGWELRWADVKNLTASDAAQPPRREPSRESTPAADREGTEASSAAAESPERRSSSPRS